ncbi:DUF3300 domain-containing protein [Rhizobium sp. BK251]|uniref:DUF3300 domain-containing protein n=1 Tax=Rhizobium sp. BK251 TaxID=2512125 RepID=UPI001052ABAD|nr:DUF3300 domain-containing protein [Rhizobium sp. BK251]TCL75684.1 uncharacterized protein DUF3300 [Rhizobium sp. BK251]
MPMPLFKLIGRSVSVAGLAVLMSANPVVLRGTLAQDAAAATQGAEAEREEPEDVLSDDELEVLVARIALYPDELVALVTSASLYPLQIIEAERFLQELKKNKDLKPKDSWDGSVISLLNYPEIVKMMSDDLDWTQALGNALTYQQKDVLIAIQSLRDKAVADGIIKSDEKIKVVNEGDNVVIQAANPEKIYIPRYEPQMLYEPGYAPAPISYYNDPYPNYYYPTATFFAAAITGAVWASVVDWNDWGVWGGRWGGNDIDIDCNNCLNNIDRDKFKMNNIDWKNVDRSKINFDRSQFANVDRNQLKNNFKQNRENNLTNRAKDIRQGRDVSTRDRAANRISVDDVRRSKIDADRVRDRQAGGGNINRGDIGREIQANRPNAGAGAGQRDNIRQNVANRGNAGNRNIDRPRPGGRPEGAANRSRPSAMGQVGDGRRTKVSANRGSQSLGAHRGGGGRQVQRGGGGGRQMHRGGGGGRQVHRGGGGGGRGRR